MSGGQPSGFNPSPAPLAGALELLVSLESKLAALDNGSEETRQIAGELRVMIEEIRQALDEATSD
jgi:hypothetical protein